MTFANPIAWALLLLAIPIILFFLLKVRFRKEVIATAMFWQQVFDERQNRKLYRRLRHLISLLLALLFITCLTAAVLDPNVFTKEQHRHVIIIDNSASMNAILPETDITRLEAAKQQAMQHLHQLTGRQVALLTANIEPKIISGFTDQTGVLQRQLKAITGTDLPGNENAAIHLAEQLVAEDSRPSIRLFGASSDSSINNLAITRFQPRRLPGHAADYEILVTAVNFGTEAVDTQLEIDRNGEIVDVLTLALPPNQPVTRIIRNTSVEGGLFKATLTTPDMFMTDNTAFAFLSEQYTQKILLYGQENFFLWHVLQSLPKTEIQLMETLPEAITAEHVLVLHQTIPETMPSGNVLILDPQNDSALFRLGGSIEHPLATTVDTGHPLVRFITPGLLFANARQITPLNNAHHTLIATADDYPLYILFQSDDSSMIVLSADLNHADFSLRTAFPILVAQALSFFRNSEDMKKAYSTTEPVRLTLRETATMLTNQSQIILISPSGRENVFTVQNAQVSLGRLDEVGVWTILETESRRELTQIACNLFNESESRLQHAIEKTKQATAENHRYFVKPIWFYWAMLALILTSAEWFLYQRRWIE